MTDDFERQLGWVSAFEPPVLEPFDFEPMPLGPTLDQQAELIDAVRQLVDAQAAGERTARRYFWIEMAAIVVLGVLGILVAL